MATTRGRAGPSGCSAGPRPSSLLQPSRAGSHRAGTSTHPSLRAPRGPSRSTSLRGSASAAGACRESLFSFFNVLLFCFFLNVLLFVCLFGARLTTFFFFCFLFFVFCFQPLWCRRDDVWRVRPGAGCVDVAARWRPGRRSARHREAAHAQPGTQHGRRNDAGPTEGDCRQ
jgi:hypothetical protein